MGIRALELARALRRHGIEARLLVPNDAAEAREAAGEVPVARAAMDRLAEAAGAADAAVVSGHAASWWFHQMPDVPVAADLYDPFPIENLHYARGPRRGDLPPRPVRIRSRARPGGLLPLRLGRAAALLLRGPVPGRPHRPGVTSRTTRSSPACSRWSRSGCPETPANGDRSAGRAAAGVPEAGPLVLFGGIYDWYDPARLLDAWPRILERPAGDEAPLPGQPQPGVDSSADSWGRPREGPRDRSAGTIDRLLPLAPLRTAGGPLCRLGPARLDLFPRPGDRPFFPHAAPGRGVGWPALRIHGGRHPRARAGSGKGQDCRCPAMRRPSRPPSRGSCPTRAGARGSRRGRGGSPRAIRGGASRPLCRRGAAAPAWTPTGSLFRTGRKPGRVEEAAETAFWDVRAES